MVQTQKRTLPTFCNEISVQLSLVDFSKSAEAFQVSQPSV